jgi:formylglycine-generating enzyme required for sulfatase activity
MPETRPLRIFISYASQDRTAVQKLYERLRLEPWIEPWFDKENLIPGMDWELEIFKAIRKADIIIVCLSSESVAKEGYVQKEFKRALSLAEEKPEGTIFVIPLRLDDCQPPMKFQQWQWVDYFAAGAHERLLKSLIARAHELRIPIMQVEFRGKDGALVKMGEAFSMEMGSLIPPEIKEMPAEVAQKSAPIADEDLDLFKFVQIPETAEVPYSFWIGKYPVTNAQYECFLDSSDFDSFEFWLEFAKFDEKCERIGDWGKEGWDWIQEQLKGKKHLEPRYWKDKDFGITNTHHPVVGVSWYEANAYCEWLCRHWRELPESRVNPTLSPQAIRLPLETEWLTAAGGNYPEGRYPWDLPDQATTSLKEILRRANVEESKIGHTTRVDAYADGASPYGMVDMAGNVWEWQANYSGHKYKGQKLLAVRGGSWDVSRSGARVSIRDSDHPRDWGFSVGFRVVALPK